MWRHWSSCVITSVYRWTKRSSRGWSMYSRPLGKGWRVSVLYKLQNDIHVRGTFHLKIKWKDVDVLLFHLFWNQKKKKSTKINTVILKSCLGMLLCKSRGVSGGTLLYLRRKASVLWGIWCWKSISLHQSIPCILEHVLGMQSTLHLFSLCMVWY